MNKTLLEVVRIAREAGGAIMALYDAPFTKVEGKKDNSPLTQADIASDAAINSGINQLCLGWPILSEESSQIPFEIRNGWQRFWLIDPLDGTKEFIKRNGEFTVNIALIENGEPILGVVYAPAIDTCYSAARGVGAFVQRGDDKVCKIKVRPCVIGESLIVVSSRSHSDARTESLIDRLGDCHRVSMGSSLKLCLVAAGEAHFYPRLGPTMEWDTAAAHAVVKYAGGSVCDLVGMELQYNKPDLRNPEFFVISGDGDYFLSLMTGL